MIENSLANVLKFLVNENRTSKLSLEKREEILETKRYGRLLRLLYPFGFWGGLIFIAGAAVKPPSFSTFRSFIVEDHASRVIRNSLDRALKIKSDMELKKMKPSGTAVLFAIFRNFRILKKACKVAEIQHFTEYARVFIVIFFFVAWKAFIPTMKPKAVLLARTNDPKRLALGAAAEEFGIKTVTYTVDRVAVRKPAPFTVDTILCWTRRQKTAALESGISAVQMPVPVVREMKLPVPRPENGVYGFLLNAKCVPEKVAAWIEEFYAKYPAATLRVRPHPGFQTEKLAVINRSVVSDWRQPLAEYLDGLNLVFALNTNAVIEALLHGVPVVYVAGLDPFEYDLHRFVQDGIAYSYSSGEPFPYAITDFYSSQKFCEKWNKNEFVTDDEDEKYIIKQLFD